LITYVDTSSLLKLLIEESGSEQAGMLWDTADALASVALVVVEARAALAAAVRGARLTPVEHAEAKAELSVLVDELSIVAITDGLMAQAAELAESDALRGYDAVHLAAALTIGAEVLTSADVALCAAADRHGLHVANPLQV
jgi:predicted nucleic acid-binding protein